MNVNEGNMHPDLKQYQLDSRWMQWWIKRSMEIAQLKDPVLLGMANGLMRGAPKIVR